MNTKDLTRLQAEKMTLLKNFEREKEAKNKAYAFILSAGLFHRFAEFHRSYRSGETHDACVYQLGLLATSKN